MNIAKKDRLNGMPISREKSPDTYRVFEQHIGIIQPWIFNQIIGWLRLYVIGTSIKAEYYIIKDKQFSCQGKAFELNPKNSDSSTNIYENIRNKIMKINSKRPFKGHYIDLEKFSYIGPYVNWRAILNFE